MTIRATGRRLITVVRFGRPEKGGLLMARRKPIDRSQYILLTEAQRLFAFRSLKQVICYLRRHDCDVRQMVRGRRRYVCIADLAAALLSHDPRRHLERTGRADRPAGCPAEADPVEGAIEHIQKENKALRQERDELRRELRQAADTRLHWWVESQRREQEKAVLTKKIEHVKGFLQDHRLLKAWEESWKHTTLLRARAQY